ncbi:preprotein translocase subunit SecY [Natronobacillus azotifigens]|uniref:Protein translocase subunit SecY n=1 Tax=Natronobacillus azotifigens TaxID=472978 RepID=A0A9J6RCN6_9BACI|nr:preprotein translocase subunit SecY [Natronobacillus azotifigens]MCZ0703456.1 preprotein translocase subunit SecY [Natronobacillus azotifigens]
MFRTISNFVRVKDIRDKIVFTLLMLIVFRLGTFIPVPFTDREAIGFMNDQQNVFGFLNTFGGGALQNFSILAMGIMPYITASIIMQLLQMDIVPKFAEWKKQGEVGRRKLAQFTRYATIVLAFIQAIAMAIGFNAMAGGGLIADPTVGKFIIISIVLTAGTAFLMWLGEQITTHGVGNGISIIIFAGIVAAIPNNLNQIYEQYFGGNTGDDLFINIVIVTLIALVVLAVTVGVIFIQQALRKIPIQYAKRLVNRSSVGGQSTHLPLKVNTAGVIPVIFAVSFIMAPRTIAGFFDGGFANAIETTFDYTQPIGMVIYVALIIAFSYFYTFVQSNPEQMAENLKKQGGYIPGIRPGNKTEIYLTRVLYRLTFVGSLFLAAVAVLPLALGSIANLPQSIQIGGTSILIVVGVALQTMKQLESQLVKRHYKGFIK